MDKTNKADVPYTAQQLAELYRINVVTIYRRLRAGKICGVKFGPRLWRIPHSEVARLLKRQPEAAVVGERAA